MLVNYRCRCIVLNDSEEVGIEALIAKAKSKPRYGHRVSREIEQQIGVLT